MVDEQRKREFTSQKSYNYSDLKEKTHTSYSPEGSYAKEGRDTIIKDIDTDQEKPRVDTKL